MTLALPGLWTPPRQPILPALRCPWCGKFRLRDWLRLPAFLRAGTLQHNPAGKLSEHANGKLVENGAGGGSGSACCCGCLNLACGDCAGGFMASSARVTFAGITAPTGTCYDISSCNQFVGDFGQPSPESMKPTTINLGTYCVNQPAATCFIQGFLGPTDLSVDVYSDAACTTFVETLNSGGLTGFISLRRIDASTWDLAVQTIQRNFGGGLDSGGGVVFHARYTTTDCGASFSVNNELPALGSCVGEDLINPWTGHPVPTDQPWTVIGHGGTALVEMCCTPP